jgi:hypothetical protein
MRLPTRNGEVNADEAVRMLRYAINHGVNYCDTAFGYHGGNSERVLGLALRDGYRERVRVATKLPCWLINSPDDFDKHLDIQLERLGTGYVDFYLLHALNRNQWMHMRDLGVIPWAESAIRDGRIQHLGFSFHDNTEAFKEIVDAYDGWTLAQIQYNFMDVENQAGTEGLRYAASKGLAVVIMEPLLGGRLSNPPDEIRALWASGSPTRSPVEWALRWLWDQPEVSVVLSGMSAMRHVEENVVYADRSGVGAMSEAERALVANVRQRYANLAPIACTTCGYCMPCPNGLDIPRNFELFNTGKTWNALGDVRGRYRQLDEKARASACQDCDECEEVCPQSLPISDWMPIVHAVLGEGEPYGREPTHG